MNITDYNVIELFEALSASALVKSNHCYEKLFECIALSLLSLDPNELNSNPTRVDADVFFQFLNEVKNEIGVTEEFLTDLFQPPTHERPPFWFKGHKFHPNTGMSEGHVERLEEYVRKYSDFDDIIQEHFGFTSKEALLFTLIYQDYLLKRFFSKPPQIIKKDSISISDSETLGNWRKTILKSPQEVIINFLKLENRNDQLSNKLNQFIELFSIELGESPEISPEKHVSSDKPLEFMFVAFRGQRIPLIPQSFFDTLEYRISKLLLDLIEDDQRVLNAWNEGIFRRTRYILQFLFSRNSVLPKGYFVSKENERKESTDFVVAFDDKVILIEYFPARSYESLSTDANGSIQKIRDLFRFLTLKPGCKLHNEKSDKYILMLNECAMPKIIGIVVFESLYPDFHVMAQKKDSEELIHWILNLNEFRLSAEELSSGMAIIKYLKNRERFLSGGGMTTYFSELDLLAFYRTNGDSFRLNTIPPSHLMKAGSKTIIPYSWAQKSYEDRIKSQSKWSYSNRNPEDELVIEQQEFGEGLYLVTCSVYRSAFFVTTDHEREIRILFASDISPSTEKEIETNNLLAQVIGYFLSQLFSQLRAILEKYNYNWNPPLRILVKPMEAYAREYGEVQALEFRPNVVEGPFKAKVGNLETGSLGILILYDMKAVWDLFSGKTNRGEQSLIKIVLSALKELFEIEEDQQCLSELLSSLFPTNEKHFSLDEVNAPFNNFRFSTPEEPLKSDLALVNFEIFAFLEERGEKPGNYNDSKAQGINDAIYQFLQNKLETELGLLDFRSTANLICSKLENIESFRVMDVRRIALSSSKVVNTFDPLEEVQKGTEKYSNLSISVRHLLETSIREYSAGTEPISLEKYLYLLALSKIIITTVWIRGYSHHNIAEYSLKINSDYSFEEKIKLEGLNESGYYSEISSKNLELATQQIQQVEMDHQKKKITLDLEDIRKELDVPFEEEFGFNLTDMMLIFSILTQYQKYSNSKSLLKVVPENSLAKKLKEMTKIPLGIISSILKYLTLTNENLNENEPEPWLFRGRLNRITVKPLILISYEGENKIMFGIATVQASFRLWLQNLVKGRLPFSTRFIKKESLKDALGRLRNQYTREFEKQVIEEAAKIIPDGIITRIKHPIKLIEAAQEIADPGEIDAFIADKQSKTLFIFEAKDLAPGLTPRELSNELGNYYDSRKGEIRKLKQKVDFVDRNKTEFAKHFSLSDPEMWKTVGTFVIEGLRPSIFIEKLNISSGKEFPLLSIDQLGDYTQNIRNTRK